MDVYVKDEIETVLPKRVAAMDVNVEDEIDEDDEFDLLSDERLAEIARGFGIDPETRNRFTLVAIARGYRGYSDTRVIPEEYWFIPPGATPLPPGWHTIPTGCRAIPDDWTAVPPMTEGVVDVPVPKFDVPVPEYADDVARVVPRDAIPPGWKSLPEGYRVLPLGWKFQYSGFGLAPPTWCGYPDDWLAIPPPQAP